MDKGRTGNPATAAKRGMTAPRCIAVAVGVTAALGAMLLFRPGIGLGMVGAVVYGGGLAISTWLGARCRWWGRMGIMAVASFAAPALALCVVLSPEALGRGFWLAVTRLVLLPMEAVMLTWYLLAATEGLIASMQVALLAGGWMVLDRMRRPRIGNGIH